MDSRGMEAALCTELRQFKRQLRWRGLPGATASTVFKFWHRALILRYKDTLERGGVRCRHCGEVGWEEHVLLKCEAVQ